MCKFYLTIFLFILLIPRQLKLMYLLSQLIKYLHNYLNICHNDLYGTFLHLPHSTKYQLAFQLCCNSRKPEMNTISAHATNTCCISLTATYNACFSAEVKTQIYLHPVQSQYSAGENHLFEQTVSFPSVLQVLHLFRSRETTLHKLAQYGNRVIMRYKQY